MGNLLCSIYAGLYQPYYYATAFETAQTLLEAYEYPLGYGVSDFDLEDADAEEIAGQALTPGRRYILWAIPAQYFADSDDAGYYLKEGTMVKQEFRHSSASECIISTSWRVPSSMVKLPSRI